MSKRRTIAGGAVAVPVGAAMVLTAPIAAHAAKDSGVGVRSSADQFGVLRAYVIGDGNSWAPGDWSTYDQRIPDSSVYRWVTDYQTSGGGGGQWRIAVSDDYSSLSTYCSTAG